MQSARGAPRAVRVALPTVRIARRIFGDALKLFPKPLDNSIFSYYNIGWFHANAMTGNAPAASAQRTVGRCDTVGRTMRSHPQAAHRTERSGTMVRCTCAVLVSRREGRPPPLQGSRAGAECFSRQAEWYRGNIRLCMKNAETFFICRPCKIRFHARMHGGAGRSPQITILF